MKKTLNIICWILAVFFVISALMYFPGISTVIFLICAALCIPIAKIDALRKKILPYKSIRVVLIVVLFIVGALLTPTHSENKPSIEDDQQANETVPESESESIADENKQDTVKESESESEQETSNENEIRDDYISTCETVVYSDIERNPQEFEGKNITVSGTVIQVSEGWFNSVTLRIESSDGIWYAKYTRDEDESRILENDIIIVYGECIGVESYRTILGSNVTIPSIKIKYYELTEKYSISENAKKYSDGQYKIGTDMPAGEYMLIQNSSISAYFAYTSDANGTEIIKNDNFDGNSIIEVYDGEYLTLSRCYAVPIEDAPDITSVDGYLDDGFYKVGEHIPAGEYKVEATGNIMAYICVYSDIRRTDIVTNDNFDGSRYIDLIDGQYIEIKRGRIYVGE